MCKANINRPKGRNKHNSKELDYPYFIYGWIIETENKKGNLP